MAKFCGICGSELVDGKCPKCDKKEKTVVKAEVVKEESSKTNALAITGFVFSLVSFLFTIFAIPGLIVSIIGLSQIKKTGEDGKGLAIAGIIISAIVLALIILALIIFLIALASVGYYY
jgi:hypothetical protein